MSWIQFFTEVGLWAIKIGAVGILIKVAINQYNRVVKQRDIALDKNLDLRFKSLKTHIDSGLGTLKNEIDALEKRVNQMSPSMEGASRVLGAEVARYERIINGLKVVLKKSDQKYSANKEEILRMQNTLSSMTEAIVSLNNKVATGQEIKTVDAAYVVSKVKKG